MAVSISLKSLEQSLRTFPAARVIGCTTAGEFNQQRHGENGVSALALGPQVVKRCAVALATHELGVAAGVTRAAQQLSQQLGSSLRELDPKRHVGVVLVDGMRMREEGVNEALGDQAPLLSFVGGSAGDNLEFRETRVFVDVSADGAALMVLETLVPFTVLKSCSFESTGKVFKVTRADESSRTVYELDGKPVVEVYAKAVDRPPAELEKVFMDHPVGLLIDGQPWIRSPQRVLPDGGLRFYCQIRQGMDIHVMRSTDLVKDSRHALDDAAKKLGKPLQGGLAFNCILRRLEIDAKKLHAPFYASFDKLEVAGFHTYGESWLGHINQTLTALLFA
ncbi:MAG: FIST C-terminal domain-containing protein [Archangiaceae bacterium]|nr:FIST C-terminal domain-containing protein [Archangiaceae bacterium]